MARLIDDFVSICKRCDHYLVCKYADNETAECSEYKAHTVDAVPVVHGRWEEDKVEAGDPYDGNSVYCFDIMRCSVCGECFDVSVAYNYCPNCGADMRERSEGE